MWAWCCWPDCSTRSAPELVWDAHSYHLDLAKRWVEAGGMTYIPYVFYSNWPLDMSVVYSLEMTLESGSTLPQLTRVRIHCPDLVVRLGLREAKV